MIRRYRFWLSLGTVLLIAICAVLYLTPPSEPSWHGRRLSEWLRQIRPSEGGSPTEQHEAELAIRALGTKAVPFLLKWSDSNDNPIQRIQYEMLPRQKQIQWHPEWAYDRQWMAANAFGVLGTNANLAVPKLARLLGHEKKGRAAAAALSGIGAAAYPTLTNHLFQPQTAPDAAFALTRFGDEAIPVLLQASFSANPVVHVAALAGVHFCVFNSPAWSYPEWVMRAHGTSALYDAGRIGVATATYSGRASMVWTQLLSRCECSTNSAVAAAAMAARKKLGL